jgi:hypothetical protein
MAMGVDVAADSDIYDGYAVVAHAPMLMTLMPTM